MGSRRKRVVSLGTFEVVIPASLPSVVPLNPGVDTGFGGPPLNFDPQDCYSFENTGYTSGYSPDHNPVYFSGFEENPLKRRRLMGSNSMPSIDDSSASSIGSQEKLPVGGDDSVSITPRWAPAAISDVQSLSARVAESITDCCTFAWQQQPAGYEALPPPAAVVCEPPQQPVMEVLPPMPTQATNSLQHAIPDHGESPRQAQLPDEELGIGLSLSADLLSRNHLLGMKSQSGQLLQPGPISDDILGLNCLSSQQSMLSNDLLNFDPLALGMYPAYGGDASLQVLPLSRYTNQLESAADYEQRHTQQLDSHHDGPSQVASSEPYNLSMDQAVVDAVPPEDEIPIGGTRVIGGDSPLRRHGPAPELRPAARPLLVDIETTSSNVYGYNATPAQILARPTTQPAMSEERANAVAQKQHPTADNQQRSGKRGPFRDQALREQTAQTRRMGSCLRCRMQRIRCEFDILGGYCLPCKKVENTKAARLPCLRYKITDMALYKTGQVPGYEWTQRWTKGTSDLPIQLWASSEIRTVYVSVCYSTERLPLQVRRFVPQEGDKLERTWVHQGTKKSALIPPYALIDVEAGAAAYTAYIRNSMKEMFLTMLGEQDDILYKTYLLAHTMWQKEEKKSEAFELLNWALRLWVAIRLSTTSAFIVGKETLDMPANILDDSSPDHGKIPLPPVMGAQMDMILIHHIQNKLRHELLDFLQKVMLRKKPKSWLVTYLVSFILLHNISLITKHDANYAKKHGMNRRFAREERVREYHMGANVILAHFHYCNKGRLPFSEKCEDKDLRVLGQLDAEKIEFVRETRSFIKQHQQNWTQVRCNEEYEDDFYFVSQLFDEKWQPSTTNV